MYVCVRNRNFWIIIGKNTWCILYTYRAFRKNNNIYQKIYNRFMIAHTMERYGFGQHGFYATYIQLITYN